MLSERVSVWGAAGYGDGALTLTPESQAPMQTDLDLALGAVGARGLVVQAPETGGIELAVNTDAMAVRTASAKVTGLAAANARVTLLRIGLEGARPIRFEGGVVLAPSLEIGVRHDGGRRGNGLRGGSRRRGRVVGPRARPFRRTPRARPAEPRGEGVPGARPLGRPVRTTRRRNRTGASVSR